MNNHEHRQHLLLILCTACIYFLADLPVQLTDFLQYGPFIGIKNFLPTTFGLPPARSTSGIWPRPPHESASSDLPTIYAISESS